jgi:hypothetical protein
MATEKIMVGIDDQVIELKGADKDAFLADREASLETKRLLEAEYEAKKQARIDAITKLGQATGLTPEEINSILQ